MSDARNFLTPVGRLVQGDVFEPQTKDSVTGLPLTVKTGPNAGQPTQRYFIAVAFKKDDPAFPALWAVLDAAAKQDFPQLFANGQMQHPKFSWKLTDGDGVDDNGKPNNTKEGFAGHWVLKFASSYPPKAFYAGRYQPHEQIQDKNAIRRGYYVRVAGNVTGNGNAQKPGLYLNFNLVELAAQGAEITSGPDASAVFGAAPNAQLPAGAVALPSPGGSVPGAAPSMPGMTPAPAPVAMPSPAAPMAMPGMAAAPAPMAMPAAIPGMAVAPNPGFVAGPGAAPAMPGMAAAPAPMAMPAAPVPPAPVAGPQMTAAANGFTYAQLIAAGWTDATLRANGMML